MSEGEVKEVQGQAISVYGYVAVMARCSDSTLIFRSGGRSVQAKLALLDGDV
jgi:hypothetical protein